MAGTQVAGYGRYRDDPSYVGCPRAKTDMTPCVARDGETALTDDARCVGCNARPTELLFELRKALGNYHSPATNPRHAAQKLPAEVRAATEPKEES